MERETRYTHSEADGNDGLRQNRDSMHDEGLVCRLDFLSRDNVSGSLQLDEFSCAGLGQGV